MNLKNEKKEIGVEASIIGIGVRLPEAENVEEFWKLLTSGKQTFREPTTHELELATDFSHARQNSNFVGITSTASEIDKFDAEYFGIPRHEASLLDPQQRFLIEVVWQALENSGHAGDYSSLRVGVFASVSPSTYLSGPLSSSGNWDPSDPSYGILVGNDKDFASSRLSYLFGFNGPSINIQTACSSSLVATHMACQSLARGECDLAIVAASSISLAHLGGYVAHTGSILSPSGNCCPFSKYSDGTVKGNGAVAVILRRPSDAYGDADRIYANIASSAITNDGSNRVGFVAPGIEGQSEAMSLAYRKAAVNPCEISFIETHGTGTYIGDRIELRSMMKALGDTDKICYLGSLKATMGHLDAAAGVASLAKVALSVYHQIIPPMAGRYSKTANNNMNRNRFIIPDQKVLVKNLKASVSSFGMGGTNAHAVIFPARKSKSVEKKEIKGEIKIEVFGKTSQRAKSAALLLAEQLQDSPNINLRDVAYALHRGRRSDQFVVRINVNSVIDAISALKLTDPIYLEKIDKNINLSPGHPHSWISLPLTQMNRESFWSHPEKIISPSRKDDLVTDIGVIMGRLLKTTPLGATQDFFLEGGDSLLGIDLIGRLEEELNLKLEYSDIEAARTPEAIARRVDTADVVEGKNIETGINHILQDTKRIRLDQRSLVRLTPDNGPEVFLIHPAGGTTSCYVTLCQQLQEHATFWGLNFPNELTGKKPTIRSLAKLYINHIKFQQPKGPYRLVGYSFGGNLAVEIALQLESNGDEVSKLVLIDSHPPHAYIGGQCGNTEYLEAFPHLLSELIGEQTEFSSSGPFNSPQEVMKALVSPSLSMTIRNHMANFFDIWCDNHAALKGWLPDAVPQCPAVILEATSPEPPQVLKLLDIKETQAREWVQYLSTNTHIIPIEGDHYSIFRTKSGILTLKEILSNVCR